MEPQPTQRSTPPPPGAPPTPAPPGATAPAPPTTPAEPRVEVCPACGEARAEDARFCEECGHDFGGGSTPADEGGILRGPVLWLFVVFWVALAIGGLIFLYTALWQL